MDDLIYLMRYAVGAIALALGLYVTARLITAAYFKSKQQHERQNHGVR